MTPQAPQGSVLSLHVAPCFCRLSLLVVNTARDLKHTHEHGSPQPHHSWSPGVSEKATHANLPGAGRLPAPPQAARGVSFSLFL